MTQWTFEATARGYASMWRTISIKGGQDAKNAETFAKKIIAAEDRYKRVEARTGVPWYFIGALHMRESSCNFAGVLHNGEHIIGTGRKTTLVPAGRGPFGSWEEAAEDALELKNLHLVKEWSAARMGFEAERFNGLGYIGKGVNSPYVWAGSNHEQLGKYVADHVFDRSADDTQLGVMTVLKRLCELRPDIAADLADKPVAPEPAPMPAPAPTPQVPIEIDAERLAQLVTLAVAAWPYLKPLMETVMTEINRDSGMPDLPAAAPAGAPTKPATSSEKGDLGSILKLALPILLQVLQPKTSQAPAADPAPAAQAKPEKDTTGTGVGVLGIVGVLLGHLFGFNGAPLGEAATPIAQILTVLFGGTAALGASGSIGWGLKIAKAVLTVVAARRS